MRVLLDQWSGDERVLADMAGVRYIEASGLNVLIAETK